MDGGPARAGVIGWPLGHSISPTFQQACFDALGLNVSYTAIPVAPDDLASFVQSMRGAGRSKSEWLGVNVTIPHKQAVAALVDDVTEEARLIGAVNTVIVSAGQLLGHNTDATGFIQGLHDVDIDPTGMAALIVGAGGAARAVAVSLLRAGVTDLAIANRSPERAESLCWAMQAAFPAATIAPLPHDAGVLRAHMASRKLIVNSTSIGMVHASSEHESPVPTDAIAAHHVVYDLVYNPPETPLLRAALAVGAAVVPGLPMLIHQGAASFERWTGQRPPLDVSFAAARRALWPDQVTTT